MHAARGPYFIIFDSEAIKRYLVIRKVGYIYNSTIIIKKSNILDIMDIVLDKRFIFASNSYVDLAVLHLCIEGYMPFLFRTKIIWVGYFVYMFLYLYKIVFWSSTDRTDPKFAHIRKIRSRIYWTLFISHIWVIYVRAVGAVVSEHIDKGYSRIIFKTS